MTMPPLTSSPVATGAAVARPKRLAADAGARCGTRAAPYLFLLPYFLITLVFFIYPLAYASVLAFYQTNGPTHRAFVGLGNFLFVLRDPDFHTALRNTAFFALCSVFLQLPLSLGLAMLLNA